MAAPDITDRLKWPLLEGALVLVLIGVAFLLGARALVVEAGPAVLTADQLFAIAFAFGVWATMVAAFVANYVVQRLSGGHGVAFRFPEE